MRPISFQKGITVEEAARLGRIEFFMRLTEMFAAEINASR
jgi:hypothetical protein